MYRIILNEKIIKDNIESYTFMGFGRYSDNSGYSNNSDNHFIKLHCQTSDNKQVFGGFLTV